MLYSGSPSWRRCVIFPNQQVLPSITAYLHGDWKWLLDMWSIPGDLSAGLTVIGVLLAKGSRIGRYGCPSGTASEEPVAAPRPKDVMYRVCFGVHPPHNFLRKMRTAPSQQTMVKYCHSLTLRMCKPSWKRLFGSLYRQSASRGWLIFIQAKQCFLP